ncbi:hypothetical protein WDZ92_33840, partial [Nostoc sp. NIES-2111]
MPTTLSRPAIRLLDFIASFEAPQGYDVIYGNNQRRLPRPLTSMTLGEVIAAQATWTKLFGSSAAGRYQFMRATLVGLKKELGLSDGLVFGPDLQDQLGFRLLQRRGFDAFMARRLSMQGFGLALAQEWASLPVLAGTRGQHRPVSRGQSYYAGDGLNKALVSPERVEAALTEVLSLAGAAAMPTDVTPAVAIRPEAPMTTSPVPIASGPLPQPLDPKPWYTSKGVIGGLVAAAVPLVSLFFPAARVIDPVTATDWLMKIVQVGGPVAGGLLAVLGRVQATRPISGSASVDTVRNAVAEATVPGAQVAPDLLSMSVTQIERQLPVLLQSLQGIGAVAQAALATQPGAAPAADVRPVPDPRPAAQADDGDGLTAAQIKAALQLFREVAESAPGLSGALPERQASARAQIAAGAAGRGALRVRAFPGPPGVVAAARPPAGPRPIWTPAGGPARGGSLNAPRGPIRESRPAGRARTAPPAMS